MEQKHYLKQNDWYDAYVQAVDFKHDEALARKIEKMVQSVWNLYADKAGVTVFSNYADDDDTELFEIVINEGVAVRKYVRDEACVHAGDIIPLFMGDVYDLSIVGMAQEAVEDYELLDIDLNL